MNKKRNKQIKKICKYIKGTILLVSLAICILYILYIIAVSIITYLHNRPIRQAVLYVAIGLITMIIDTVNENRAKAMHNRTHTAHGNRCNDTNRHINRERRANNG